MLFLGLGDDDSPSWGVITRKAKGQGPPWPLFHGPERQLAAGGGKGAGLRLQDPRPWSWLCLIQGHFLHLQQQQHPN